jgi:hypothetical protein
MPVVASPHFLRALAPPPQPGLSREHFRLICPNGLGDPHNSYAHSMTWYKNHIYVGTTRSNFCMLKIGMKMLSADTSKLAIWPVECPETVEDIYKLDRRAQIWRYNPVTDHWQMVFQAPMVMGLEDKEVARDIGYRTMVVFQGPSDPEAALYVGTWTPGKGPGPVIMRSFDGETFEVVSDYGIIGQPITTTRLLIPFQGRLFTSPTATRGAKMNVAGIPVIYESRDPAKGVWFPVSEPGFGEEGNQGVFSMCPFAGYLYAGTVNNSGFQIWRTDGTGKPPYRWQKVMEQGAYRGSINQIALSMVVFGDALYIGSGIQNGGYDVVNNIGPAASELIRLYADGSWDLIVGSPRETIDGKKIPLSGLPQGFGNFFNGYFWRMGIHEGWLYIGTYDASNFLPWIAVENLRDRARRFINEIGIDPMLERCGCEVWRSHDGENWLPVTKRGFDNPYNVGIRNFVSTPHGLFIGTANPYGPRIAVPGDSGWEYVDNPRGGLEVWCGSHD